jgi:hypothetical protein
LQSGASHCKAFTPPPGGRDSAEKRCRLALLSSVKPRQTVSGKKIVYFPRRACQDNPIQPTNQTNQTEIKAFFISPLIWVAVKKTKMAAKIPGYWDLLGANPACSDLPAPPGGGSIFILTENAESVLSFSPALARQRLRWVAFRKYFYPERVASKDAGYSPGPTWLRPVQASPTFLRKKVGRGRRLL